MSRKERGLLSSTAEWGLIGGSTKLWPDEVVTGLEAIAWKWLKPNNPINGRVIGLHGRIGSLDVLCKTLDALIIPSSLLIEYARKVGYVLVHEGEARQNRTLFEKMQGQNDGLLLIENGGSKNSLDRTVELVEEFRKAGVNAGLMFDLAHEYKANGENWNELFKRFGEVSDRGVLVGIHLPFGEYPGDALPFEKMTEREWRDLARVIKEAQLRWLVIENRHKFPDSVGLTQRRVRYHQERNIEIVTRLKEWDII